MKIMYYKLLLNSEIQSKIKHEFNEHRIKGTKLKKNMEFKA